MSIIARLEMHAFDPASELGALIAESDGDGAVVSFVGLARSRSRSGAAVEALLLETHPKLTVRSIEEIARSAKERFDVSHVRVVHRGGRVAAGAPVVFAGACARHRRAAFEAADYLMDRLKTEAVFWKREVGESGSEWIEPVSSDHDDRKRWD